MTETDAIVLGPGAWTGAMQAATRAVPGDAPRATALLRAFHERHVPLTPRLAAGLAAFERSERPAADVGWGRAYALAGEALGVPRTFGQSRFWRGAAEAFRLTVAEPLLRDAAQACDGVALLGAADLPPPAPGQARRAARTGAAALESRAEALEFEVERRLSQVDPMGRAFWIVAGLGLHVAAREAAGLRMGRRKRQDRGMWRGIGAGAIEPAVARLLFEIEPAFEEDRLRRIRRTRSSAQAERRRAATRPKEGGVVGIVPSRSLDDLPDALVSEWVLPRRLLAARLLDEGLLVRHRPPRRDDRRDLFLLTAVDRRARSSAGATVAKAAWADAAIRLRTLLPQAGRPRSDLMLQDLVPLGRGRHHVAAAEDEAESRLDIMALSGRQRAERLFATGLPPDFALRLPPGPVEAEERPIEELLRELAVDALRDLRREAKDYAATLAILIVDAGSTLGRRAQADWGVLRLELGARLGLRAGGASGARLAVLVAPAVLEDAAAFLAVSDVPGLEDRTIDIPVPDGMASGAGHPDADAMARLLGALSEWIIETTLGAVDA